MLKSRKHFLKLYSDKIGLQTQLQKLHHTYLNFADLKKYEKAHNEWLIKTEQKAHNVWLIKTEQKAHNVWLIKTEEKARNVWLIKTEPKTHDV